MEKDGAERNDEKLRSDLEAVLRPKDGEMKKRCNALLCHLSSLPSPFGIGVMGEECASFALRLAEANVSYWQILPITYPSQDSPYQSYSAFAGNPWFIDPRGLVEDKLLLESELESFVYKGSPWKTDYAFVRENAERYLRTAYFRLGREMLEEIKAFVEESFWLEDFASFMTARRLFDEKPFWEWPDEALRRREPDALRRLRDEHHAEFMYHCFVQWLFFRQWSTLKQKINALGVGIFGDIPFYVASDSADIWAAPQYFMLREDLRPLLVAGVPPDYFSEDGQLWGNTVYDWESLKASDYDWWLRRISSSLRLYDLLRIDHFRGFESYWVVPAEAETARHGAWRKGPAMELFSKIREKLGELHIVAEDLGDITPAVKKFLLDSGFPGMKVLQFAFDKAYQGKDLPHNYPLNTCAYTGTHDNNTTLGWLWAATEQERNYALDYCGFTDREHWGDGGSRAPACRAVIRTLWASAARMSAVPIQDLCGFGEDTRMNLPGVAENMWQFRLPQEALDGIDFAWLKKLNVLYQRNTDYRLVYVEMAETGEEEAALGLDEPLSAEERLARAKIEDPIELEIEAEQEIRELLQEEEN